jgi:alpha-L-fucosidase
MRFTIRLIACFLYGAFAVTKVSAQEFYKPTWESLDNHKIPQWYEDAKIGLSMHWGIYSVPAWAPREEGISYAEWYGYRMHENGMNPTD